MAELNDAYQGTALLLGDVVEADDTYTGEHSKSVVRLALDVAEAMGLDDDRKRGVEFGALLHDVGKIAVPKEIINKPGKLNEREWEVMKTHTIEGQKMLEKIGGFMVRDRAHRARVARELGRERLSRRIGRRGDPSGGAGRRGVRCVQRDDDDTLLSQSDAARRTRSARCGRAPDRSSIPRSWTRCRRRAISAASSRARGPGLSGKRRLEVCSRRKPRSRLRVGDGGSHRKR